MHEPSNRGPIRPAVQEIRLQQPVWKSGCKDKTQEKSHVIIREPLDVDGLYVEVKGHQTFASIDLQTIVGDLMGAHFVYLYKLLEVKIEPRTQATAIKGSTGTVDKTCEVELHCAGYE